MNFLWVNSSFYCFKSQENSRIKIKTAKIILSQIKMQVFFFKALIWSSLAFSSWSAPLSTLCRALSVSYSMTWIKDPCSITCKWKLLENRSKSWIICSSRDAAETKCGNQICLPALILVRTFRTHHKVISQGRQLNCVVGWFLEVQLELCECLRESEVKIIYKKLQQL